MRAIYVFIFLVLGSRALAFEAIVKPLTCEKFFRTSYNSGPSKSLPYVKAGDFIRSSQFSFGRYSFRSPTEQGINKHLVSIVTSLDSMPKDIEKYGKNNFKREDIVSIDFTRQRSVFLVIDTEPFSYKRKLPNGGSEVITGLKIYAVRGHMVEANKWREQGELIVFRQGEYFSHESLSSFQIVGYSE